MYDGLSANLAQETKKLARIPWRNNWPALDENSARSVRVGDLVEADELATQQFEQAPLALMLDMEPGDVLLAARFELGALKEPLDQLQTCATILGAKLTLAGMVTSEKARGATPIDQDEWSKHITYPGYLLRNRVIGNIRIRLTVNPKGRAINCQITGSSSPQVFDDEVCFALMKHARFNPALDQNGEATTSYYNQEVRFGIK